MIHYEKLFQVWAKRTKGLEGLTESELKEYEWNKFALACYLNEGQRVFRVEPGLARLLLDTQLPNITGDLFRLPFSAMYLEFPGRLFLVPFIVPEIGGVLPFIGCYLVDMRPKFQRVGLDIVVEPTKQQPGVWDFLLHIDVDVKTGEPVDWGDLFQEFSRPFGQSEVGAKELMKAVAAQTSEMCHLVVNAILYATSASPEITNVVSQWRGAKKAPGNKGKAVGLPSVPNTRKYLLGSSIPVTYGAPKASDSSPAAAQDRKLLKRFRVRGHWKWQACGVGHSLRKHIFVAPYWKGPKDVAELLARKYRLQ